MLYIANMMMKNILEMTEFLAILFLQGKRLLRRAKIILQIENGL